MVSALINNAPDVWLDFPPCGGWLAPRISFSRDADDDDAAPAPDRKTTVPEAPPGNAAVRSGEKQDPEMSGGGGDFVDFEFRLDDPAVGMLPADELFSGGKLIPLHLAAVRTSSASESGAAAAPATAKTLRVEMSAPEVCVFSPKAPSCSSRWRELLGLKRSPCPKSDLQKSSTSAAAKISTATRSLKYHFLHRSPRSSSADPAQSSSLLGVPLLRDSDSDAVSISSSRLSLSSTSSSSGHEHDDLPRFSLDSHRAAVRSMNAPRLSMSRPRQEFLLPAPARRSGRSPIRRREPPPASRGASVDSPRMSASGRVVFQGLERSSSIPGSIHGGGARPAKQRPGMERSYSAANVVRVSPVLNVPVCSSLRGGGSCYKTSSSGAAFGLGTLFSPQKAKDRDGSAAAHHSYSGAAAAAKFAVKLDKP